MSNPVRDDAATCAADLDISEPAWARYQLLVENGAAERPGVSAAGQLDDAERELVGANLARLFGFGGRTMIAPLAPVVAMDEVLAVRENGLRAAHASLLDAYAEIEALQRRYERTQDRPALEGLVTILTNPADINALSGRMENLASWDFSAWYSGPTHPSTDIAPTVEMRPPTQRSATVVKRSLCDAEDLAGPGTSDILAKMVANGEQVRSIPVLPTRMMIADDTAALLPLLPTGMNGAVLITANHLVRALRTVFDEYWKRGVPLDPDGSHPHSDRSPMSGRHERIVELLLAGWKDEAIARQVGTSTRTVRRHIEEVLEMLGVQTRIQAGAELIRRGWVG